MANGFQEALMLHLQQVYSNPAAVPSKKITPPGYTKMLLSNSRPNIISTGRETMGHTRDVKIKYQTRGTSSIVATEDNCDIDVVPVYNEATISSTLFRKIGLFIDDSTIRQYEIDASKMVQTNGAPTPFMKEFLESIINKANGLVASINTALLGVQVSAFGKHQETGSANAVSLNLPLDRTTNNLSEGMSALMARIINNELDPNNCMIVGNGKMLNYMLQQKAKSADQAGLNTGQEFMPGFLWDPSTASSWGADQFGVFEKDAVQLIEINKFVGSFAGLKGSSWFFNAPLPLVDTMGDSLQSLNFDMQLKYHDCPTEVSLNGYETQSIERGYVLTLSKKFHQFNVPADAYEATDRLTGNRGTLRFAATNT